ncbi:SixA phosphatase family protein [Kangiella sediminilitoris]|uniref:Putative phosphohistidine phosphatase, SixA n=1 Tax=Kangiella sediminilitoris TaxID=1144748 RepID=A0A1B3BAF3_9GAMM|nr:histidine phosphatase family protein [Kangiella sediminilitoris]AOE49744.1 Putative phosphohistidine phosphatase, SixA [Kangiella sediminilitoris]
MGSKKLYIFRHGKSDWKTKYTTDYERPLADRGIEAAKNIGAHLSKIGQIPDYIVSSSAKRCSDTVNLAVVSGGWDSSIKTTRSLYLAGVEETIEVIQTLQVDAKRLMLVTHEPLCSSLVSELCMGANVKFPTASIARLDFKIKDWSEIDSDKGQLAWLLTPKSVFGK